MTTTSTLKITTGMLLTATTVNVCASIEQSLTIPLTLEFESNPQLSVSNEQSVRRGILTPNYSITSNQGTNPWFVNASLRVERSSDEDISQNRDDPSLNLGWSHHYETGQFGVTGFYNEQSTRISEFSDSGLVRRDNTKKTRALTLNWANNLNERTSIALDGTTTQVAFVGSSTIGLVDYRDDAISTQLNYNLSEQLQTFARISFSLYQPDVVNSLNTETRSMDLGIDWEVNEKLNITASIGPNKAIREDQAFRTSWQGSFTMQYATLRTSSNLSLSRDQSPSSTGNLEESYRIAAGWSYSLTERDNIVLDLSWRQNLTLNKIETSVFTANYTRELNPSWDLGLSAEHKVRDDKLTNASSSSIMASIIYKIPDF